MSATVTALPGARVAAGDASFRKWLILVTAALGALLEVIDTSIVNVALTDMQASLGATLSEIGWVVTIYAIANVIILPMSAWLGDRFGKKRYFIFSLIAFTAASILCGLATSLPVLILARLLQGLGGGGLLAKAQAIIFETFPPAEQAMAQAIFGICVIAGPAIGPTLGGWLVTNMNWRWIFFVNLPVGIVAVIMASIFLHDEPARPSKTIDWLGIFLLVVAVGSLQTVLEEGHEHDWWSSKMIVWLSVCAVVGLICFVWRQLTVESPVVDLRVLKHRSLAAGSLYALVLGMGLYGAIFCIPVFAQSILQFTAQQTGMLMLPSAIASGIMFPFVGKMSGKFDARVLITVGALVLTSALIMLTHISPDTGDRELFWPLMVRGFGTVLMYLPLTLAAMSPLPKRLMSAASGFMNLTRQLGGSIGIALLTTFLDNRIVFHRQILVDHLSRSSPAVQARMQLFTGGMMAHGADAVTAGQRAIALMEATVAKQAAVMSFADCFWIVGVAFVVTLPLLLLLGSGKGASGAEAH
jgi:DHA2 family multidrug resistance protein